jgi:RNA polymerase sigma-70 factor (ECF subfamily)
MSELSAFTELLVKVRAGDARAAEELVRRYERDVRVAVRAKLRRTSLRRLLDSTDVCQSVLASFFTRMALGEYELAEPAQLIALLGRMARNKLTDQYRKIIRREELVPQVADGPEVLKRLPGPADPARIVAGRELLEAVYARLDSEERDLANRRGQDQTWVEIAAELGGSAQARRKQLGRAISRIAPELGTDESRR